MLDCPHCHANRNEFPVPGGPIHQDDGWRVEHACGAIPMIGWLMLKPLRHVESLAELNEAEATTMGIHTAKVSCSYWPCE
jgi:hypothetical protein